MSVYTPGKESVIDVHASYFSPCSKCSNTCFLLHDYLPADCPLQTCDVCSTIAKIDEEISKTQKLLSDLAKKRQDAKRHINSRHDRLFGRLPVEVISRIFRAVAEPCTGKVDTKLKPTSKWASTALLLGAVCKGWRDITLGTPHLWTTILVNLWKDSSNPDVVKEWLHRSRSLPLSIFFLGRPPRDEDGLEGLGPLLKVVRSHSGRWRRLTSEIPSSALHALFHQLEDVPETQYLSIDFFSTAQFHDMQPASLPAPLCPEEYIAYNFSSEKMLFEWHNLTRLRVFYTTLDELVHIVRCAPGLTECAVNFLRASEERFPLPMTPIRHESLKVLDAGDSSFSVPFFDRVTFPSLQNLQFNIEDDDPESIGIFSSFLKRSAAPLSIFSFRYSMIITYDNDPWAQGLAAVTDLEVVIDPDSFSMFDTTDSFFKALVTSNCLFPNLRNLRVTTPIMTNTSWTYLADFLLRTVNDNKHMQDASDSGTGPNGSSGQGRSQVLKRSTHARPLQQVRIQQTGDMYDDEAPIMGIKALSKFEHVMGSGITLDFVDNCSGANLLDSAARYHLEHLEFFGDDLDSDTSGSDDTDSNESASDGFEDCEDSDE